MKFFVLLFLIIPIHGMQRQKPHPKQQQRAQVPIQPQQKPPLLSLEIVRKDLIYALNLNDTIKTKHALQELKKLNKEHTELECLEIETHNTTHALVYAMAEKSKAIAREMAKIEIGTAPSEQITNDMRNKAATSFQKAIQEHAKALTNQELVANFFLHQLPPYKFDGCDFNSKPIFEGLPL